MSSLPKHFIIIVDGQHVAKPENDRDEIRPAQVGEKPATFELDGNHLISGDWALGLSKLEGHVPGTRAPSLAVFWFRKDQADELYPVYLKEGDDGPQLRFALSPVDEQGRPLAVLNKQLLCYTSDNSEPSATVQIVPSQD
ncbi:hypothetical protein FPCIR_1991 [Fusarium pseudocircinatum]|uniref:Uncharacterized protein n=1 Tax=Fusarium pseudocircinatum TaxID=56676 RepID=A0A8H5PSL5_9HYPO|nr:hypothetical protein FPCIR_1991 [Fusarium pseudocircinatum]